jgi:hypothetical protein
LADIVFPDGDLTFIDLVQEVFKGDPFPSELLHMLSHGVRAFKKIRLGECE